MEISGEDDQTNSAGARPAGRDLQQQQEWWTQTHLPDDQTQEQDWWNQTHVPSRQVGEHERSEHRPAPADSSEAPEQSVQPSPSMPMPMQLMNTPCIRKAMCPTICGIGGMMINNGSGCKFNLGTALIHGTSVGLWPPALDITRITVLISGILGMPMIGINGHLGLHVAMGGRRGHSGLVNRRNTSTRARLQNGTEIILRKPGATVVAR